MGRRPRNERIARDKVMAGAASSSRHVFAQSSLHKCGCSNPTQAALWVTAVDAAFCRHRYDTEPQGGHAVAQDLYPALDWRHYEIAWLKSVASQRTTQLGQRQDDEESRLLSAVHNCFSRDSLLKVIQCTRFTQQCELKKKHNIALGSTASV